MTRRLMLALAFCLVLLHVQAQDGVNFRSLTLEEAVRTAKKEKKMLFVDCYTQWCGPCQKMARTVFPKKEAGDFFNPRFVCVKYDLQQGEGPGLKGRFGISAYPTFLILDSDGHEIGRIVGGDELESFIARIERKVDRKRELAALDERYRKRGRLGNAQLLAYYLALQEDGRMEEADRIYGELGRKMKRKERLDPHFWPYFAAATYGSEDFAFILDNLDRFREKVGKPEVEGLVHAACLRQVYQLLLLGQTQDSKGLEAQLEHLDIDGRETLLTCFRIAEKTALRDVDGFIGLLEGYPGKLDKAGTEMAFLAVRKLQKEADRQQLDGLARILGRLAPGKTDMGRKMEIWRKDLERRASTGTRFEEIPFAEALEMARELDKKLFLDCYTSWCGPCKLMLQKVFPQEKVGSFINGRFIPLKVDMGRNDGPVLKKLFGIRAYPTFLIVNPDGSLYHKTVGEDDAEAFIRRLDVSPELASSTLERRYLQGDRDKRFMARYISSLRDMYSDKAGKVTEELYGSLTREEKTSPDFWFIFENARTMNDTAKREFVLANRKAFYEQTGEKTVDSFLAYEYLATVQYIFRTPLQELKGKRRELGRALERDRRKIEAMDLATDRSYRACFDIARSFLTGNLSAAVSACRRNLEDMAPEDIPFAGLIQENGGPGGFSPEQREELLTLGRLLYDRSTDGGFKEKTRSVLEQLETGVAGLNPVLP